MRVAKAGCRGKPLEPEQVRLHLGIRQQLGLARRSLGDSQQATEDFLALAEYARTKNQSEWEMKALLYAAATLSWIDHERCLATVEQAVALSRQLANKASDTPRKAGGLMS